MTRASGAPSRRPHFDFDMVVFLSSIIPGGNENQFAFFAPAAGKQVGELCVAQIVPSAPTSAKETLAPLASRARDSIVFGSFGNSSLELCNKLIDASAQILHLAQ